VAVHGSVDGGELCRVALGKPLLGEGARMSGKHCFKSGEGLVGGLEGI
jgi:hypothetical protein